MAEQHDDHDGIEEHDNHLPNWWLATLFGAVAFSFVYWGYYQTLAAGETTLQALQHDEAALASQRAVAALAIAGLDDAAIIEGSRSEQTVKNGAAVFQQNCIACHGMKGEGSVGPNLTDPFWLHGGRPLQIYTTIANGVVDKGMLAWMGPLGETKVREVAAFIMTLKNTNVPGKAPQGDKDK